MKHPRSVQRSCLAVATAAICGSATPEVVFDGTLGPLGVLSGDFVITDAFGTQVGPNLFHSFETFNVNPGESATFASSFAGVTNNVIGRVTGGTLTTIDGLLASSIPGADLWLINPSGVAIGDNATLDLLGGLHIGTADYLALGEDGVFDASDVGNTLLSVADPAGFGFVDADVAPIAVGAGGLFLGVGQDLSLVGGDISLNGTGTWVPGGRTELVSVASQGLTTVFDPEATLSSFAAFGDITADGAWVSANGNTGGTVNITARDLTAFNTQIDSETWVSGEGGGLRFDLHDLDLSQGGNLIATDTYGSGNAGSIDINATGTVTTGNFEFTVGSQITSFAWGGSTGNAGSISIDAASVDHQFSTIGVFQQGTGTGGTLEVSAADSIFVQGGFGTTFANNSSGPANAGAVILTTGALEFVGGSILARALGDGLGGDVIITADTLTMSGGTQFSVGAFGLGNGGNVVLDVADTISMSDDVGFPTGIFAGAASGQGGGIQVRTGTLNISDGAQISNSIFWIGNAGDIDIEASNAIRIDGIEGLETGIFTNTFASGNAGTLTVSTPLLELIDGGSLQASSLPVVNGGQGGSIIVNVDDLVIRGTESFITVRSFGDGDAGDIDITATGDITMEGVANTQFTGIFASTDRGGDGGDISIATGSLTIGDAALIRALTFGEGNAGSITIDASGSVMIHADTDPDSGIQNSTLGPGSAGSIDIAAGTLTVSGFGTIEASSLTDPDVPDADPSVLGDAADISIRVGRLDLIDGGGIRVQTVGAGDAGQLTIEASDLVDIGGANALSVSTLSSQTSGSGTGGSILVAADRVHIYDGGLVTAESSGTGNAGTVQIVARDTVRVDPGGSIETESQISAGGNIDIEAGRMLLLDGGVVSAAAGGVTPADDGGNVTIDPDFVVLRNGAILASANAGNGGNISIRAGAFVIDTASVIDASSNTGLDGRILIDSPNEITDGVIPLEAPPTDARELATRRCVPQLDSERSTLVATLESGVSRTPDGFLESPRVLPGRSALDTGSFADSTLYAALSEDGSCFGTL